LSPSSDVYFGPERITINSSKKGLELTRTLNNPRFNDFESLFTLKVQIGGSNNAKVNQLEISIDGNILVSSSDFKQKVFIVEKQVTGLTAQSILKVTIKGQIGSYVELLIEGKIKTPSIGDFFGGGLVFYIFQPGDNGYIEGESHGFILAPHDQGLYPWGCEGTRLGTSRSNSGQQNTDIMIENCSGETAASICDNLVLNGYEDWYLPSPSEFELAYNNLYSKGLGNFGTTNPDGFYWSSLEYIGSLDNTTHAHILNILNVLNPIWDNSWKSYPRNVRAARTF
jgi:hypothetical protein